MTGLELDRRLRDVIMKATHENILSSAAALVELGFGAHQSFDIVLKAIMAKELYELEKRHIH